MNEARENRFLKLTNFCKKQNCFVSLESSLALSAFCLPGKKKKIENQKNLKQKMLLFTIKLFMKGLKVHLKKTKQKVGIIIRKIIV